MSQRPLKRERIDATVGSSGSDRDESSTVEELQGAKEEIEQLKQRIRALECERDSLSKGLDLSVQVSDVESGVQFKFSDYTCTVSTEDLERSTVVQCLLGTVTGSGSLEFATERDVRMLQLWAQAANPRAAALHECIKAVDFYGDDAALRGLIKEFAYCLLPLGRNTIGTTFVQELEKMEEPLARRVVESCRHVSLCDRAWRLPRHLHYLDNQITQDPCWDLLESDDSDVYRSIEVSPDGLKFAVGLSNGEVQVLDILSGVRTLSFEVDDIERVVWNRTSSLLAIGTEFGHVIIWDVTTKKEVQRFEGHGGIVYDLCWSPNDNQLATGGQDMYTAVWDFDKAGNMFWLQSDYSVLCLTWHPDGSVIALGLLSNEIEIWDPHKGTKLHTLEEGMEWARAVEFSPDGKSLAIGCNNSKVAVWDCATWTRTKTLDSLGSVWSVSWKKFEDGRDALAAGTDNGPRIWLKDKVWTRGRVGGLEGMERFLTCQVVWLPQGEKFFCSCSYQGDNPRSRQELNRDCRIIVLSAKDGSR